MASVTSSSQRQTEVAVDFVSQVDDEFSIVDGDREPVPRERLGRWSSDVRAIAPILRAVAWAQEPVGQPHWRSTDLDGLRRRERLGAYGAAQVRAHR